jgi:hypothetical protein
VLELGCGAGDSGLAEHFEWTGIDLVARAPAVIEADFLELELPDGCCDACVSFSVFNHVPRERLPELLAKIHRRTAGSYTRSWPRPTCAGAAPQRTTAAGAGRRRADSRAGKRSGASDEH